MAKAFYGRAQAYETGMDEMATAGDGKLTVTLRELVYKENATTEHVAGMAAYLMRADRHLGTQDAAHIAAGEIDLMVAVAP